MIIDNGTRLRLEISDVFLGDAGVVGSSVSFVPNQLRSPSAIEKGVLDGKPILLWPVKEKEGPFWNARFMQP